MPECSPHPWHTIEQTGYRDFYFCVPGRILICPMPTPPLVSLARALSRSVNNLSFSEPVSHVYNPLDYTKAVHEFYLTEYGSDTKRVLFLGMNPGPFGMAQTGVPFGEIAAARDWMKVPTNLAAKIKPPANEHPKRPIQGFACEKSEVSGRRLWGLFAERFGTAKKFFAQHFVANYCPLVFMNEKGANVTPDKLKKNEAAALFAACDDHLAKFIRAVGPEFVVGIGKFAEKRAQLVCDAAGITDVKIVTVLHPSPASPAANKGWAEKATTQLIEAGVWPKK